MTVFDGVKKCVAVVLGVVTLVLWVLGTLWFKNLFTGSFNNAGYVALPFGSAFVVIGLLPLITITHRTWISGSPAAREEAARQQRAEAARFAATHAAGRGQRHDLGPGDL